MARITPRKVFKKISGMGDRPNDPALKTTNVIFFVLTIFFSLVYFMVASTDEIGGTGDHLKDDITNYLLVVSIFSLILLSMEFYHSLEGHLKLVRFASVIVLIVFAALSIPKVIDMAKNSKNEVGDTLVYTFAALTLGFAGGAGIINGLEIIKIKK